MPFRPIIIDQGQLRQATAEDEVLIQESDPIVRAINGIVKSNGTTISVATAGVDYATPAHVSGAVVAHETIYNHAHYDTAYSWGNHADAGYLTDETDPVVRAINGIVKSNGTTISAAVAGTDYAAANHTHAQYLTAESDPVFAASAAAGIATLQVSHWDTAYGWGNHASAGYLTAETDPVVRAINGIVKSNGTTIAAAVAGVDYAAAAHTHAAYQLIDATLTALAGLDATAGLLKQTGADTFVKVTDSSANWNTAYGWGNHASAGYLTAETDPVVKAINGIVKSNGTTIAAAVAGVDYAAASHTHAAYAAVDHTHANYLTAETDPVVKAINGIVRSNGTTISAAVAGTDYFNAASQINHNLLLNYVAAEHINWSVTGVEDIHADRIAASAVTQHVASIDHNALLNYVANQHIDWTNASANFKTTGNVGVGVTATVPLHVYSSSTSTIRVDAPAAQQSRIAWAKDGTNKWILYSPGNSNDLIFHDSAGRLTVMSGGGLKMQGDNYKLFFGTADDASLYFDGTSLVIDPNLVTSTDTLKFGGPTVFTDTQRVEQNSLYSYRDLFQYRSGGNPVTGTLQITMPRGWTNTMMRLRICGYQYQSNHGAWDVLLGSYNYSGSGGTWTGSRTATITGNPPFTSVRVGYEVDKCVILLGTTTTNWYYPHVYIKEMDASNDATTWAGTWAITFITDESAITNLAPCTLYTYAPSRIGINTLVPEQRVHAVTEDSYAYFRMDAHRNDNGPGGLDFRKSRGTQASPAAVIADDNIATFFFFGWDLTTGGAWRTAASMVVQVDGTPGGSDMPGRFVFNTSPDGSASPNEQLRITNAGNIVLKADTDTYWSHPAADTLAWTTGGTERARMNNTGLALPADNYNLYFGAGNDASIYFDGSYLCINPHLVTSTDAVKLYGDVVWAGATSTGASIVSQISVSPNRGLKFDSPGAASGWYGVHEFWTGYNGAASTLAVRIKDGHLEPQNNITLVTTTSATTGIINKGTSRFLHNFKHPTGGGAIPSGYNVFVGELSGNFTMGATATQTYHGSYNVGVGYETLRSTTTGYQNIAIGAYASYSQNAGYQNVAIGLSALYTNQSGGGNIAIGYEALKLATAGANVAVGRSAGTNVSTGTNNVALGYSALNATTTGHNNVGVGYHAGTYLADGATANQTSTYSIYIGTTAKASAAAQTNEIVIGYNAIGLGSNTVVLGNDSVTKTALKGNVGIGTTAPDAKADVTGTKNTATYRDRHILTIKDDTALAAGAGGAISFQAKCEAGGTYAEQAMIEAQRKDANPWEYESDLVFYTRPETADLVERLRITSDGSVKLQADNQKLYFGAGDDASIYFDGTYLTFDVGPGGAIQWMGDMAIGRTRTVEFWEQLTSGSNYHGRLEINDGGIAKIVLDGKDPCNIQSALIGWSNGDANYAKFGHTSFATGYALLHSSGGDTYLNAESGRIIYLRNNNADVVTVDTNGLHLPDNKRVYFGTDNDASFYYNGGALVLESVNIDMRIGGIGQKNNPGSSIANSYYTWGDGAGLTNYVMTSKANGTEGSPTATAFGDVFGQYQFYGYSGGFKQAAMWRVEQIGAVTAAGNIPGRFIWYTMDGSDVFDWRAMISPWGFQAKEYFSADGSQGATATVEGMTFKNGLMVGTSTAAVAASGSGGVYTLSVTTTSTSATPLLLGGASFTLPANKQMAFRGIVVGKCTSPGDVVAYEVTGLVSCNIAGTTNTLLAQTVTNLRTLTGYAVTVTVSGNVLQINVKSNYSAATQWTCRLETAELTL